jgi:predicted transcriptional regulator
MRTGAKTLTEVELEIMRVVWELEEATVRQVHERLAESKDTAYTTVMTMMSILADKGHLEREKHGRAFVYRPTQPKGQVVSSMVEDFVSKVFDGAARPLVLALIKDRKLSRSDLEEIARMIEESEERDT